MSSNSTNPTAHICRGLLNQNGRQEFPLHEKSHDANLSQIFDIFMVLFFHVFLVVFYN